jgi:hypothetical protein
MIKGWRLSTTPVPDAFTGGRSLTTSDPTEDWETGGVNHDDPSQGLRVKIWHGWIEDNKYIFIESSDVAPLLVYTGANITEVSITFDQNMRYAFAFVEDGIAKLNWYDTTIPGRTTLVFDSEELAGQILHPKITMDDKRGMAEGGNDILYAYLRGGELYYRQQRDRFVVERWLANIHTTHPGAVLVKMGMNKKLRVQFEFDYLDGV